MPRAQLKARDEDTDTRHGHDEEALPTPFVRVHSPCLAERSRKRESDADCLLITVVNPATEQQPVRAACLHKLPDSPCAAITTRYHTFRAPKMGNMLTSQENLASRWRAVGPLEKRREEPDLRTSYFLDAKLDVSLAWPMWEDKWRTSDFALKEATIRAPVNILLHLEEASASKAQQQGCGGRGGQLPWHPDQSGTQAGRQAHRQPVRACVSE